MRYLVYRNSKISRKSRKEIGRKYDQRKTYQKSN